MLHLSDTVCGIKWREIDALESHTGFNTSFVWLRFTSAISECDNLETITRRDAAIGRKRWQQPRYTHIHVNTRSCSVKQRNLMSHSYGRKTSAGCVLSLQCAPSRQDEQRLSLASKSPSSREGSETRALCSAMHRCLHKQRQTICCGNRFRTASHYVDSRETYILEIATSTSRTHSIALFGCCKNNEKLGG